MKHQQNTTNQTKNPYERVLQREARRREFEKMAATMYGPNKQPNEQYGASVTNQTTPGSSKSKSPITPTYHHIPRPPIPGEKQARTQYIQAKASVLDQPTKVPPAAFIPLAKGSLLPEPRNPLGLLPFPDTPVSDSPTFTPEQTVQKSSKALLPSPGLLKSPQGLLPDPKALVACPKGLLPSPKSSPDDALASFLNREFKSSGKMEATDWKIISDPAAPVPKNSHTSAQRSKDRQEPRRSTGGVHSASSRHHDQKKERVKSSNNQDRSRTHHHSGRSEDRQKSPRSRRRSGSSDNDSKPAGKYGNMVEIMRLMYNSSLLF